LLVSALVEDKAIYLLWKLMLAVGGLHNYTGIAHRDLKEGNIMIGEGGKPKIIDFGLASPPRFDTHLGTYNSPERYKCYRAVGEKPAARGIPNSYEGECECMLRTRVYAVDALV